MNYLKALEYNSYYHIYNVGIDNQNIFKDKADRLRFLKLIDIYVLPVADIYAYALLNNHFHWAVRIKKKKEIGYLCSKFADTDNLTLKWKTYFPVDEEEKKVLELNRKPKPEYMFQHLFSAYTKYFNKKYKRQGNLMLNKFRRIKIHSELLMKSMIIYIHYNPVKHDLVTNMQQYRWTSYLAMLSKKKTKLERIQVLNWFENRDNFVSIHQKNIDFSGIEDLIIED